MELGTSLIGLTLRSLTVDDKEAYLALVADNLAHLTRYGDYEELQSINEAKLDAELRDVDEELVFGVRLDDRLIGRVDLVPRDGANVVIGYWLAEVYTGRGFATSACAALLEHARLNLGATDVWAGVTTGNEASERLLLRLRFEMESDQRAYRRFHRSLLTERND
jgi:RimJ/RimL family protein N-acetyltransferase